MSATACYIYLSAEIVSEMLPFVQFASFPHVPRGVTSQLAYARFRVVLSGLCWKVLYTYYPCGSLHHIFHFC